MSKWKVYISSTFRDLKDFRADLINLFQNQLKNNFELCEIMERMFDDGTYTPFADDCVQAVLESDIYIIILGNKIGSFPPDEDRTYTEIELDTALANDKRIFCLRLEEFDESDIDNKTKHDELLGKFKGRPIHTFKDSKDLKSAIYEFLIQFTSEAPINAKNPYKGLASFNVADGDYFFGRDAEIESCLKKIITASGNFFVSVIGNSGTGKSSFVKAGLMYRLKTKEEYGFTKRKQILVTPASEPFTNLKYQMQLQGVSVEDVLNLNAVTPDLILFFDQFEEVITQCQTPEAQEERKQLFEFLDALASNQNENSKVLVICTFRSDFLSQLANFDFIKSHQYLFPISSLDYKVHADNWEQSMSEIISRPALKNGVVIEKELVELMLEQIKEVDGSLPILQFTLERIWNKETIADRRISSTEFNKLSEGKGISGIIETHAENVIKSITNKGQDKEREAILKTIFVNLVEVNENLNDVKRTVSKDELYSILKLYPEQVVNEVFETLVSEKSRLLNVSQDKDDTINVGIIHEELIRKWDRLKGWIGERREALETKKRISLDIAAFNKGEDDLYGRKQLKRAKQWEVNNPDLANEEINLFLLNSRRTNNNRFYKRSGIIVMIAALISTVFFVLVQPAIQKRSFVKEILEPNTYLNNQVLAGGGIDSITNLTINQNSYDVFNKNLKYFDNLKTINIDSIPFLKDLSIIQNLKNPLLVNSILINHNENLENIYDLTKLKNLTSLVISGNNNLQNLTGVEKLKNLTSLVISGNLNLYNLTGIEKLENLTSLVISGHNNLKDLTRIEKLKNLTSLVISDNFLWNLKGIEKLKNLTSLVISGNPNLYNLTGIEKLKNLTSLEISGSNISKDLTGIEKLKNLTSLVISGNNSLKDLTGIEKLKNLTSLVISGDDILQNLTGIEKLENLTSLVISGNFMLQDLTGIEKLENLTSLVISGNWSLQNLTGIEKLYKLRVLDLSNNNLQNLTGIEKLENLTSLEISGNFSLNYFTEFEKLENLTSLVISGNNSLKYFTEFEKLENLTSLVISGNGNLLQIRGIEKLENLTSLEISGNWSLQNLTGIEKLYKLRVLDLSNNNLQDLTGIEKLENLTSLEISGNWSLQNLTRIEKLKNLTSLDIKGNNNLQNLTGIEKLENLTSLVISGNFSLQNLTGIEKLSKLKVLDLSNNSMIDVSLLLKNNPELKIRFLKESN